MPPCKSSHKLILITILLFSIIEVCKSSKDVDWTTDIQVGHGFDLRWLTTSKEFITMEMTAPTEGWVAVGFTNNGAMNGADIVMGWVDDSGKAHIKDLHGVGNEVPVEDPSQDVELIEGKSSGGLTTIRFKRKWNTCDGNDYAIGEQTVKLIWSYGKGDPSSKPFNPAYHERNRGVKFIKLRLPTSHTKFPEEMETQDPNIKYFDITMDNVSLPGLQQTEYMCRIFQYPNFETKAQIVGWRPLLQPENAEIVHHMVIYDCAVPKGNSFDVFSQHLGRTEHCYSPNMPPEWLGYCWNQPIAWNLGGEGGMFPLHTGMPIGEKYGGATYFMIEMHYDNPDKVPFMDNSGLRIYYTQETRPQDLSTLYIGKRFSSFHFMAPGAVGLHHYGGCSSECTQKAIHSEGIYATQVILHGHEVTKKIFLRHIRNGIELPLLGGDTNYENNYQNAHLIIPPRQILPGDEIITYCHYDTTDRNVPVWGGVTTNETEMCHAFLQYYPKIKLTTCQYQTEYNDFLNAIGIKKLEGDLLPIVSTPFKPKRNDKFNPPDEVFVLLQQNRSTNLFSQLTIMDEGKNYKKNFWDYLVALDWKGNDAQLANSLNRKLEKSRSYAYCTEDAHVRIPLKNYILYPPKFKKYVDPAESYCKSTSQRG